MHASVRLGVRSLVLADVFEAEPCVVELAMSEIMRHRLAALAQPPYASFELALADDDV